MYGDAQRLSSDLPRLLINDMFDCWESQGYAMNPEQQIPTIIVIVITS
jgi:hypothetical protein